MVWRRRHKLAKEPPWEVDERERPTFLRLGVPEQSQTNAVSSSIVWRLGIGSSSGSSGSKASRHSNRKCCFLYSDDCDEQMWQRRTSLSGATIERKEEEEGGEGQGGGEQQKQQQTANSHKHAALENNRNSSSSRSSGRRRSSKSCGVLSGNYWSGEKQQQQQQLEKEERLSARKSLKVRHSRLRSNNLVASPSKRHNFESKDSNLTYSQSERFLDLSCDSESISDFSANLNFISDRKTKKSNNNFNALATLHNLNKKDKEGEKPKKYISEESVMNLGSNTLSKQLLSSPQPEWHLNYADTKNFESDEYPMIEEMQRGRTQSFDSHNLSPAYENSHCDTLYDKELKKLDIPLTVVMFILKHNESARYIQNILNKCQNCTVYKCRNSRLPKNKAWFTCESLMQCFESCRSNSFIKLRIKEILIEACPTHLVILQTLSILKPVYTFQSSHSHVNYVCYIYNCVEGTWTKRVEKILLKDGSFILKNFRNYGKKKFR
ncbi:MAG: hypothetical protein MHMPM18_001015 [Marteilia pararefringens]